MVVILPRHTYCGVFEWKLTKVLNKTVEEKLGNAVNWFKYSRSLLHVCLKPCAVLVKIKVSKLALFNVVPFILYLTNPL